jgi:hypothetical protein
VAAGLSEPVLSPILVPVTYLARSIRITVAGVNAVAGLGVCLVAIGANPYVAVDAGLWRLAVVLLLPFTLYVWFVRTRRASVDVGVGMSLITAGWIVLGYGALTTTDDGLGFMAPLLGGVLNLVVAFACGVVDRLMHPSTGEPS